VTFLMFDAFGHGGVARSVLNLAARLAEHRDVRLVSLYRRADEPAFPIDPRIELEVLLDARRGPGPLTRVLHHRPTRMRPLPAERQLSRLTDRLLRRRLRSLSPGILVTTRPSLHLAAARWAAPGVRLVGQDHKNFPSRFANPRQAALLREAVPALDSYVVLTNADAEDYRRDLPQMRTHVSVIRNALPWPVAPEPAPLDGKVVVAAGRLAREKGFGRLVEAFAPVAREHPDWQLHVYGEGSARAALETRVRRLGLEEQIRLPGYVHDFRAVLTGASAYALTSRAEGFPMVLIEAMSLGVPLVAMDCPRGPGEIVDDGKNGFLVPDGDVDGFTEGLRALVEDDELRRRCGRQAHEDARQYSPDAVVADWLGLFERLDA
jgi:glycosyltransferase involved in cell wall biosynthesis